MEQYQTFKATVWTTNGEEVVADWKMAVTNPTVDWDRIGNSFYRKVKLFESLFDQELELENYVIAGAPYCGAIGASK